MGEKRSPILIGCLAAVVLAAIVGGIGMIWLMTGPQGGVRLGNEVEEYAVTYIEEHGILEKGEKIVAYYDITISLDGTEAAILTDQRLIYHKNGKNNVMDLADIKDIQHREEGLIGDVFDIFDSNGNTMKIEIAPLNQGGSFKSALMNAWNEARNN